MQRKTKEVEDKGVRPGKLAALEDKADPVEPVEPEPLPDGDEADSTVHVKAVREMWWEGRSVPRGGKFEVDKETAQALAKAGFVEYV